MTTAIAIGYTAYFTILLWKIRPLCRLWHRCWGNSLPSGLLFCFTFLTVPITFLRFLLTL